MLNLVKVTIEIEIEQYGKLLREMKFRKVSLSQIIREGIDCALGEMESNYPLPWEKDEK